MEIKEISKKSQNRVPPEKYEEMVKKLRKEHEKPVKGMFEFIDAQGGWFDFAYRFFKDEPLMTIRLVHGEITELPMGIVKHLNNTKRKVRRFAMSEPGKAAELPARGLPSSYELQSRIRFTPVDVF